MEDAQIALGEVTIRGMAKEMVWLEELAETCSTKGMGNAGYFVIRATANSKIIAWLLQ
jgi:hypothetical protein